jgi:hypothetical protein
LNSGPCVCQASTLPLEPWPRPQVLYVTFHPAFVEFKPRVLDLLDTFCTTKLHPQPCYFFYERILAF